MRTIDLNADLGEGMPWDFELLKRVTSASVSCGAHAGTDDEIRATLAEAKQRGVVVGAHPSWPDREGFGRVPQPFKWGYAIQKFGDEQRPELRPKFVSHIKNIETMIIEQVNHLKLLAGSLELNLWFIKPHGALYNQANSNDRDDFGVGLGVCRAAVKLELPIMGLPRGVFQKWTESNHVSLIREGFPDRRYGKNGRLLPRSHPDALIHDRAECVEQALKLIESGVESLCLHGDSPTAVEFADALLECFAREEIVVRSFIDRG